MYHRKVLNLLLIAISTHLASPVSDLKANKLYIRVQYSARMCPEVLQVLKCRHALLHNGQHPGMRTAAETTLQTAQASGYSPRNRRVYVCVCLCVSPVFIAKAFTNVHRASFPCTRVNIFHCNMRVLNGIQTSS